MFFNFYLLKDHIIKRYDIQHKGLICDTQYNEYYYAECCIY